MAKAFKKNTAASSKNGCYYEEFTMCTNPASSYCDQSCPGKAECGRFISQNDYFLKMMNGDVMEEQQDEDVATRTARIKKNLTPEKTRKQIKFEEKREAEKNKVEGGYSFMDDPRFKDLFKS